jgi:two-component system response regulator
MTIPITVLVAEDNEDDLYLSKRVLLKAGVTDIVHVWDGMEAMDYLAARGAYAESALHPRPDVVLLDLKMPHATGHEVLEWLGTQPGLKGIPVYVLTSSDEPRDRLRAEQAGAHGYLVKPLSSEQVVKIIASRT